MRSAGTAIIPILLVGLAQAQAPAHVTFQNASISTGSTILRTDNGTYGPSLEEVHYYYDELPIGLAVASDGRIFSCYTRGNYTYTLSVATNLTHENPFPAEGHTSVSNAPADAINTTINYIPFASGNESALISVQALYITPENTTLNQPEILWVLDSGRPTIHTGSAGTPSYAYAQPGGPKLVGLNITAHNDSVYASYTFPADVHFPDSYFNDVRFDFSPNLQGTSGKGVAYLVDSSNEGRPGFIMLDLGTGESWRRLTQDPSVLRVDYNIPSYAGRPFYEHDPGMPILSLREGLDGIQLSPSGDRLYYSPLTSTSLYSIPTINLRARDSDPLAELAAHGNISHHGQRGGDGNGFEGDSNGKVYMLMPTQNAIYYYDPSDLQAHGFLRDPRILWPDSASVAEDGYIYVTVTQLFYQPDWNNGIDGRVKPGAVVRAKLNDDGVKHVPGLN